MKEIYIDVETTGVNSYKNDLVQLSGIIEIHGEEKERFDILSRPIQENNIDPKALKVIGKTKEELMEYPPHLEGYHQFTKIMRKYVDPFNKLDKFLFIGYNSRFDEGFLRSWFYSANDRYFGSWFHWPAIDISNICALYLADKRAGMKNFKLMTVAEEMGIDIDESQAHDAMYDIIVTREMYKIIRPLLQVQKAGNDPS